MDPTRSAILLAVAGAVKHVLRSKRANQFIPGVVIVVAIALRVIEEPGNIPAAVMKGATDGTVATGSHQFLKILTPRIHVGGQRI